MTDTPMTPDRNAPWGRSEDGRLLLPMGAHWTDVPELFEQRLAGIQARVDQAQSGNWYEAPVTERVAPGTVRTRVDGYPATVGQFTNLLPGDLALILHAHADLRWLLEMTRKLRARVAELEARPSRAEVLDEAAAYFDATLEGRYVTRYFGHQVAAELRVLPAAAQGSPEPEVTP